MDQCLSGVDAKCKDNLLKFGIIDFDEWLDATENLPLLTLYAK